MLLTLSCGDVRAKLQGQALLDSMLQELPRQKEDTNKANLLNMIASAYVDKDPGLAEKYLAQEMVLAKSLGYQKGIGNAFNLTGHLFFDQGKYNEALYNYNEALKIRQAIDDKKGTGGAYCNIGNVYAELDKFPETLNSYFAALKTLEEIGDKPFMARVLNNIGVIYANQQNFSEALKNYKEALKLKKEINDLDGIASSYCNIGNLYNRMGKYREYLEQTNSALKIYEQINSNVGIASCYVNIGALYLNLGNDTAALSYLFKALKLAEELQNNSDITITYQHIGAVYLREKKYKLAEDYELRSIAEAKKAGVLIHDAADLQLSMIYEQTGQYANALKYYKAYKIDEDSTLNKEKTKKLLTSQLQYDFDKRELTAKDEQERKDLLARAEIIKQKNEKWWVLAAAVLLLIIASGSVYFLYYTRKSKRAIEMLMKEIHHRVKNNLQVIGTLLQLQLRNISDESAKLSIEEGISRISSIALIHQHLYQATNLTAIEFSGFAGELLQQVSAVYRKPDQKLDFRNEIPETWFDMDTALPLGLVLNELMTNSYKYAYQNTPVVKMDLKLILKGNEYMLEYCDNGPGLAHDYEVENAGSLGMTIIKSLSHQLGGSFIYRKSDNCFVVRFLNARARKNIA